MQGSTLTQSSASYSMQQMAHLQCKWRAVHRCVHARPAHGRKGMPTRTPMDHALYPNSCLCSSTGKVCLHQPQLPLPLRVCARARACYGLGLPSSPRATPMPLVVPAGPHWSPSSKAAPPICSASGTSGRAAIATAGSPLLTWPARSPSACRSYTGQPAGSIAQYIAAMPVVLHGASCST